MNIKIAISSDVLDAIARLPKAQQSKVREFLVKFRLNPRSPGLNFERINGSSNDRLRSVRIDQTYRAIVLQPEHDNVYLVVWVDHHDAAYEWAARKQITINPETGGIQVYNAVHTQPEASEASEALDSGLFSALRDRELVRLGVPLELVPLTRTFRHQTDLFDHEQELPREAFESLFFISEGASFDEVARELDRTAEQELHDVTDFDAALARPESRRQFVLVDDDLELEAMLNAPLEKWRVFLHPSQRKLVEVAASGPVRVLGGAGTGKTVVAMHRARHLATTVFTAPTDRILFTTFTRNLAADIEAHLQELCDADTLARIEVVNFDQWVARLLKSAQVDFTLAYGEVTKRAWEPALATLPDSLALPPTFYQEEFYGVVLRQGIETRDEYLVASRIGRGRGLNRRERAAVWPVFEAYREDLRLRGFREPQDAFRHARQLLESSGRKLPYRAVIVDEAQDMTPEAMRLIRQILPGGDQPNDLFIVGDAHQRIYGYPLVLSHCGINIRGRSRRLRINYRTPEEVRNWAVGLLTGMTVDDMDGGTDSARGYRSLMHGLAPDVRTFDTFKEEVDFIVDRIGQLGGEAGDLRPICLVARTQSRIDQYTGALDAHGIPTYAIRRTSADDRSQPGVRLATMHRVKGIEFDHMIVASVNADMLPLSEALASSDDPVERRDLEARERALLYVAATRAKETLVVTSFGPVSAFLSREVGYQQSP